MFDLCRQVDKLIEYMMLHTIQDTVMKMRVNMHTYLQIDNACTLQESDTSEVYMLITANVHTYI